MSKRRSKEYSVLQRQRVLSFPPLPHRRVDKLEDLGTCVVLRSIEIGVKWPWWKVPMGFCNLQSVPQKSCNLQSDPWIGQSAIRPNCSQSDPHPPRNPEFWKSYNLAPEKAAICNLSQNYDTFVPYYSLWHITGLFWCLAWQKSKLYVLGIYISFCALLSKIQR